MGASDRAYFGWLTGAIGRFERAHGRLAGLGHGRDALELWGLAEHRVTPVLERIHAALGAARTQRRLFDHRPPDPSVRYLDFNRIDEAPPNCCDVLTLFRASHFIADPARTLAGLRRMLRPGGLAIVDWVHGSSDAPVLDFRLDPAESMSTYMDPIFLAEFPREFRALIAHVNRPPWGVNVEHPGTPLGAMGRLRQLAGRGPRRDLTLAGYIGALRADLAQRGRHLVEPSLLEQHFKVLFRDARYLYRETRRFNLYLLTVLQPTAGGGHTMSETPAGEAVAMSEPLAGEAVAMSEPLAGEAVANT